MLPEIVHIKLVDAEKFNQAMYDNYRTGSGISPKVAIIKVIRNLTGISLKKAKIYMESVVDEHCTYTFQLDNVDVPLFENSKSILDELGIGMISNDEDMDEDVSPYMLDKERIMLPELVHLKVVDVEKFNRTMDRAYTDRNGRSPKVEIIKVIRTLTGLGLKEAKGLMESLVDDGYTITLNLHGGDVVLFENSKNVLDYFGIGMISNDEDVSPYYVDGTTIEEIAILAIKRKDFDILEDCVKLLKKLNGFNCK